MATKSTTIECDWPDCKASIVIERPHELSDANWETRGGGQWSVCPEHRFKSTADLQEELDAKNPRPCPFCGGIDIVAAGSLKGYAYAVCESCKAVGPEAPIECELPNDPVVETAAFKSWNRRDS